MPFTFDGDWIPSTCKAETSKKPVKVRLIKKGHNILTVILNLCLSQNELSGLASSLKKKLGCGGAIKDGIIEIQGDKVLQVKELLLALGIKSS
jgi:translation initiation factor 1